MVQLWRGPLSYLLKSPQRQEREASRFYSLTHERLLQKEPFFKTEEHMRINNKDVKVLLRLVITTAYCKRGAILAISDCFERISSSEMEDSLSIKFTLSVNISFIDIYTDTASTSSLERNQEYCESEARMKITGIQPARRESKSDFRVRESPGGAGQKRARRSMKTEAVEFNTCVYSNIILS